MPRIARVKCVEKIDATICKLQEKRGRFVRADARRMAVRGYMHLNSTAKKYDYVCFREEFKGSGFVAGGAQDRLIQHNGNFKKILHEISRIYVQGNRVGGGMHFTDDPKTTSCYYWHQRLRRGR